MIILKVIKKQRFTLSLSPSLDIIANDISSTQIACDVMCVQVVIRENKSGASHLNQI